MPETYRNAVTGRVIEVDEIDPALEGNVRWVRDSASAPASAEEVVVEEELLEQPSGNASADEWRAFAVAAGMDEETAAGLSRNELREYYGS